MRESYGVWWLHVLWQQGLNISGLLKETDWQIKWKDSDNHGIGGALQFTKHRFAQKIQLENVTPPQ